MKRRNFLKAAAATSLAIGIPASVWAYMKQVKKPVRMGMITDLHQDIMHDGQERLEGFLREMEVFQPDALVQLGDFAVPKPENKAVVDIFNKAHKHHYHVIGNHDTDGGYTKEQCMAFWQMSTPYYTAVIEGVRIIVLDGNEKGSPAHKGGYPSYIGEQQCQWLEEQLVQSKEPVVIISHQPLAGFLEVDNAARVRSILSAFKDKVLIALNGHSHIDAHLSIDEVNYVHINSASYFWVGGDHKHQSYPSEVHKAYPWIEYTCPYASGLFAALTIDPAAKAITISGSVSNWVGQTPKELGYQPPAGISNWQEIAPEVTSRNL